MIEFQSQHDATQIPPDRPKRPEQALAVALYDELAQLTGHGICNSSDLHSVVLCVPGSTMQ